ncbi:MAG: peptidyl-prolyl cis-trans isomerase [Candidatus Omnitrophica bacterium]|nr:peptidyl-prolyl cis-trans isomerase [Candidatus Omnitrophota bacterium]MCF7894764.1 peptidyl-prolyl cis-trans isomerase [Candidatus Omnitrophota bacterium]MCF7917153.1 peptidyl-prolyl cis-trans isomerase [Candidatus Omnitrophota bacterium]
MSRYGLSILIIVLFLFVGCDKIMPVTSSQKKQSVSKPTVAIQGPLLAKVNGWAIGLDDFKQRLDALKAMVPQEQRGQELSKEDKKNILQELVNLQILSKVANEKGMDKDKDVKEAVENFKNSLLTQKLREKITTDIIITEAEITNFYNTNRLAFQQPEERKVREIVVGSESQAKNILIRLLQGENFSALARTVSISKSAGRGGDLGYITPDPEKRFQKFWETAFTTDKGETSSYFKGPDGHYIVKVEDIRGGEARPLAEVKDQVRQYLEAQKVQRKIEDLVYKAKQRLKVTINDYLIE